MGLDDIRALVFDMGGILYDTPRETTTMTRYILDVLGLSQFADYSDRQIESVVKYVDEIFDKQLVQSNVDSYWLPSYDDSVEYDRLILENLGVKGNLPEMASKAHLEWTRAYPSMKPKFLESCRLVLETLRSRGYLLGVASNRRNDPISFLEPDGILSGFDTIEYSCVPGFRKPSPFMLLRASMKMGINPRKCAYIGDKVQPDAEAATRAEFLPILLVWCAPEEAEKATRDMIVIHHISELMDLFPGF